MSGRTPARLTLVSRQDCELCEQMRSELLRLGRRFALPPVDEQDVDGDPELLRRYGLKVPVLLLDGCPVCHGRLDASELRRLLRR